MNVPELFLFPEPVWVRCRDSVELDHGEVAYDLQRAVGAPIVEIALAGDFAVNDLGRFVKALLVGRAGATLLVNLPSGKRCAVTEDLIHRDLPGRQA